MRLRLIVAQGKREGKIIPVTVPQFVIGRHSSCQLKAASPLIGKHHCALLTRGGKAYVHDFDSVNGTFVNGEPVQGERELCNEDCLKAGPLMFLVWLEAGKDEANPPAAQGDKDLAADESAIAKLLLDSSKGEAGSGILGVGEDSGYGSTVMTGPAKPAAEEAKPKKKARKPKNVPEAQAPPGAAKEILERHKRRSEP